MSEKITKLVDMNLIEAGLDPRYVGSKFEVFKNLHPSSKGSRAEKIVLKVLRELGYPVRKRTGPGHDLILDLLKHEQKSGCLNKDTNVFSFLQLRPAQDYERYLFAAFLPNDLRLFVMSKERGNELIMEGVISPQHGGIDGGSGTYMYYPTLEDLERECYEIV